MARKSDNIGTKGKPRNAPQRRSKGFLQTGGLLNQRIRNVSERRGFAQTRLLTHWAEVVGSEIAAFARPIKVSYAREGIGATLTVLVDGARAPELQMMLPTLKDKVNACYGYSAISRIRLTQTAEQGFGEDTSTFLHKKPVKSLPQEKQEGLKDALSTIKDDEFRTALELLGKNVLTR